MCIYIYIYTHTHTYYASKMIVVHCAQENTTVTPEICNSKRPRWEVSRAFHLRPVHELLSSRGYTVIHILAFGLYAQCVPLRDTQLSEHPIPSSPTHPGSSPRPRQYFCIYIYILYVYIYIYIYIFYIRIYTYIHTYYTYIYIYIYIYTYSPQLSELPRRRQYSCSFDVSIKYVWCVWFLRVYPIPSSPTFIFK